MNRRRNVRRILSEEHLRKRPKPIVVDTRNLSKWYIFNIHCQKRCWFGYFLIVTECLDYAVNKRLRITYEEGSGTLFRFLVITSQLAVRHFFLRYLMYLRAIRIRTPTESEDEDPRFFYP
uniref:Uncharacterized protein n=1 Tax=Ascaris lumbricoides TaxID=6252 RepID=A0A0M3HZQ2_ASCLU